MRRSLGGTSRRGRDKKGIRRKRRRRGWRKRRKKRRRRKQRRSLMKKTAAGVFVEQGGILVQTDS